VASPVYKQAFDLRTGICLDDPKVRLRTYRVRVRAGMVEVLDPSFESLKVADATEV